MNDMSREEMQEIVDSAMPQIVSCLQKSGIESFADSVMLITDRLMLMRDADMCVLDTRVVGIPWLVSPLKRAVVVKFLDEFGIGRFERFDDTEDGVHCVFFETETERFGYCTLPFQQAHQNR